MKISGILILLIALFTSCEQTDPEPTNNFKDFPEVCPTDMLLPGKYEITQTAKKNSLIIKIGTGDNQITYHLKRHETAE